MHALPWVAIFLAAALAIARVPRALTLGMLAIGYASAFALGRLEAIALLPIALLVGTGLLLRHAASPAMRLLCNFVFVAVAIGLFQHKLP
ncbi:CPBP family intramembrane metalloprotease domain-containing protein, partial [Mesorhizobium sp. M00.F.Ca.ET.216.01.1.1]